jgi:hypothetical protein
MEKELRTILFFHQYFDCRANYGEVSLQDLLRKPPQFFPRQRVAKVKVTPTANLSQRHITRSDGTIISVDDARKNHVDTKAKYQQAYLNAMNSL